MKKSVILLGLAFGMIATACTSDEELGVQGGKTVLKVGIEDATRTGMGAKDGESYPVTWTTGDKVAVNGVASEALVSTYNGQKVAEFTLGAIVAAPYEVAYPADYIQPGGNVVIPAQQQYNADSFQSGAAIMFGTGSTLNMVLHHACGFLKIPVTGDAAKTLNAFTLTAPGGEALSGEFTADYATATLTGVTGATSNKVRFATSGLALSATPVNLIIAIPAGAYAQGFKVQLIDTDSKGMTLTAYATAGKTVTAGRMIVMPTVAYTGTDNVVEINNAAEMQEFIAAVNGGDYSAWKNADGEVVLGNDIDLTGVTLTPAASFDGTFNGQGYALKNWAAAAPLFTATVAGSTVKNVKIDSTCALTYVPDATATGTIGVGFLAGTANGSVLDCTTAGAIKMGTADAYAATGAAVYSFGGLVGVSYGAVARCNSAGAIDIYVDSTTTMDAGGTVGQVRGTFTAPMTNTGNITMTGNSITNPVIGGVAGYVYTSAVGTQAQQFANYGNISLTINSAAIKSSVNEAGVFGNTAGALAYATNYGNISCVNNQTIVNNCYVAGVAGITSGTVDSCENMGAINAYCAFTAVFGGVIASTTAGPVTNCVNYGTVTGRGGSLKALYCGGVVAYMNNSAVTTLVVKDCTNYGEVKGSGEYQVYVGGVVGYYNGKSNTGTTTWNIDGCVNHAPLTMTASVPDRMNYMGGVCGSYGSSFSIKDCTNDTTVTSVGVGCHRAGGIAGMHAGVMQNCSNSGAITLSSESTTTTANYPAAGGICGHNGSTMSGCTNTGAVAAMAPGSAVGGLVGTIGNTTKTWTGCTVDCAILSASTSYAGVLVGGQIVSGTTYITTAGTTESPIVVKNGTNVNGVAVVAADVTDLTKMMGKQDATYGTQFVLGGVVFE